jgi:RimJ/RimL family protein N-acetyltransferase
MTLEEKIEKAISLVIDGYLDDRNHCFNKGHKLSRIKMLDYFTQFANSPSAYFDVKGESFITAYVFEHEWAYEKFFSLGHFFSNDRHGIRLLKEAEKWGKEQGAVVAHESTYFNNNPKLIKYFERLGYQHVGYSFVKYF